MEREIWPTERSKLVGRNREFRDACNVRELLLKGLVAGKPKKSNFQTTNVVARDVAQHLGREV